MRRSYQQPGGAVASERTIVGDDGHRKVSAEASEVQSGERLEKEAISMDAQEGSSSDVHLNKKQPCESCENGITAAESKIK